MELPFRMRCAVESAALPAGDARLWVIRCEARLLVPRIAAAYAIAMPVGVEQTAGQGRRFRPIVDAIALRNLLVFLGLVVLFARRTRSPHLPTRFQEDGYARDQFR